MIKTRLRVIGYCIKDEFGWVQEVIQKLEKVYSIFGFDVFIKELDREYVPGAQYYLRCATGLCSFKSKFASLEGVEFYKKK